MTSCSIRAIGNSGARSSGPTGSRVPGCSGGGGGDGRSGMTLYHWVGCSDSSSRIFVAPSVMAATVLSVPMRLFVAAWPPADVVGALARARPAGRDRDALDHGRSVARDAAVPRRRRRPGPGGRGVDGGAAARRPAPSSGRTSCGSGPTSPPSRWPGVDDLAAAVADATAAFGAPRATVPRPPDDRPVPAGPPRGRRRDDAAGGLGRHRHRPRPLGAPSRRRPLRHRRLRRAPRR